MELFTKDEARTLRKIIKRDVRNVIAEEEQSNQSADIIAYQKKYINRIYMKVGKLVKEE